MEFDMEAHLHEFEVGLERVKSLYERYFIGSERSPPSVPRKELERLANLLSQQSVVNSALRFRYQNLVRRFRTYSERWDRVSREVENGTYGPHLLRVKRKAAEAALAEQAALRSAGSSPTSPAASTSVRATLPPGAQVSGTTYVPGMSEAELRGLHLRYVEALRSVGDPREVKYEALVASLGRQVPDILAKNRADLVSFAVSVKDGKVVLRATPRRSGATNAVNTSSETGPERTSTASPPPPRPPAPPPPPPPATLQRSTEPARALPSPPPPPRPPK
jgi:hypothetical protein